jgi:hypothetical protein
LSGPKVVRIVSREEILRICNGELARVDAAIAEWERVLGRCGLATPEAVAEVRRRRAALGRMLAAEQWMDIQKQAPLVAQWVFADIEERVNAQFSPEARLQRGRAGLSLSAASLAGECERRGVAIPDSVSRDLAGSDPAALSRAVSQVMTLLSSVDVSGKVDAELRSRLATGVERQSLDDWLAVSGILDARFAVAEKHIGYLHALSGDVALFEERLAALRSVTDAARQGLLLDALCLELSRAVAALREQVAVAREAAALQAELALFGVSGAPLELGELRAQLAAAKAERAAVEARLAVLDGLRELGYEVREGMSTAWESDGKLVLKHPSGDGYGVEFGGRGEKLQVRAVSFGGSGCDVAAEERWCGEFGALRGVLAGKGAELEIVRATPVGAQPVKRVVLVEDERREDQVEELRVRRVGE